jgi:hypothetical protein
MTKSMKRIHTRDEIAAALAKHYSAKLNGKVWSYWDEAKRAYAIQGENLPPHPDLKAQYLNGWSMLDYIKPAEAHKILGLGAPESKRILDVTVEVADTEEHGEPFTFIDARARVKLSESDLVQIVVSGGMSFEIDSLKTDEQTEPFIQDELDDLRRELHAIGFSQRAITAAFKDVVCK